MVEILFVQPYSTEFPFFQHVGELVPQERQHLLARVDTELSTGTRNLPVDGAYGKAQTVGDVSVRIALNHIAQDFGNRLAPYRLTLHLTSSTLAHLSKERRA